MKPAPTEALHTVKSQIYPLILLIITMVSTPIPDFLPLLQNNEFLPPISRWTRWGGLFMVGAVGVAIALCSVTKYRVTVKAQAQVRPAGELRLVQTATQGSVISISARENQEIKKGDIIATLDDSNLQTEKQKVQINIQQAQRQMVQVSAQISALNRQIQAETNRINRAVASANAQLSHRQRDYRDLDITSHAQFQEAEANVSSAQNELQKAQIQLTSTQANLKSSQAALNAARSKLNRYQPIAQLGALSQNQLEEAQLAVEQHKQTVEAQKATVEAQHQTIEQLKQAVKAAQAKQQSAKASLNPSDADVAIAALAIAQEQATGEASLAILAKEKEALIQQRIEIQKQLERNNQELQQIDLDLEQTTIRATADGIISQFNLRNPGQTVQPGQNIAQIVPSDVPLEIKAAVSPADIGKLDVGQTVQMRVSACPYPDYGTLNGVVRQISEDTIQSNPNQTSAIATVAASQKTATIAAFYQVTIEPERLFLTQGKNQCALQFGMEGRADIIAQEETVLTFLLRKARLVANF